MEVVDRRVPLSQIGKSVGPSPLQRFIANVRRNGVVVPVLLREVVGEDGELEYRVIDGNRRVAAARQLRLPDVPAQVVLGASDDDAARLTLMANNFRSGNDITEFWAIKQLERSGVTRSRIAQDAGITIKSLDLRNRWSALDRRIFVGFATGRISASVARKISRLPREDQQQLGDLFATQGRIQSDDVDALRRPKPASPFMPVYENDLPMSDPTQASRPSSPGDSSQPDARNGTRQAGALSQRAPWSPPERYGPGPEQIGDGEGVDLSPSISNLKAHPTGYERRTPDGFMDQPFVASVQPAGPATTEHPMNVGRPVAIVTDQVLSSSTRQREFTAAEGPSADIQRLLENVASMGFAQGVSFDALVDALRIAYRQVEFVQKVTRETVRGSANQP